METTTLHIRNIPVGIKARFKAYCAAHDYTMEKAIMALMVRAYESGQKLPEAGKLKLPRS
jgi:plasmid stability protein